MKVFIFNIKLILRVAQTLLFRKDETVVVLTIAEDVHDGDAPAISTQFATRVGSGVVFSVIEHDELAQELSQTFAAHVCKGLNKAVAEMAGKSEPANIFTASSHKKGCTDRQMWSNN